MNEPTKSQYRPIKSRIEKRIVEIRKWVNEEFPQAQKNFNFLLMEIEILKEENKQLRKLLANPIMKKFKDGD